MGKVVALQAWETEFRFPIPTSKPGITTFSCNPTFGGVKTGLSRELTTSQSSQDSECQVQ